MPGHLEKRGKDIWRIVLDTGRDPLSGKRQRMVRNFRGNKRDAEREMARLVSEMTSGTLLDPSTVSLKQFLDHWLATVSVNLAPKTALHYGQIVLRITEYLGNARLQNLKPAHVQQFYSWLADQRRDGRAGRLSPSTVLYHHRVLHKALDMAVKWQLVSRNACDSVEPPKQQRHPVQVLDEKQVSTMLEHAKRTKHYAFLLTAVLTGMRRGEILALRWDDVDFGSRKIYVSRSLQYVPRAGLISKEPKTAGSRRAVSMAPTLVEALRQHRKRQIEHRMAFGPCYEDHALVFCQVNGKPIHPDTPSSWFPRFLERIGLPRTNFHSLRHTCASLLLKQGIPAKIVADILGHSSTRITDDIYSHVLPGVHEDAIRRLDELIQRRDLRMGT